MLWDSDVRLLRVVHDSRQPSDRVKSLSAFPLEHMLVCTGRFSLTLLYCMAPQAGQRWLDDAAAHSGAARIAAALQVTGASAAPGTGGRLTCKAKAG